jgi:hypothetical protein
MHERDAFRAIFSYGGSLSDLDRAQVSNVPAAVANARAFAVEVLAILRPSVAVGEAHEQGTRHGDHGLDVSAFEPKGVQKLNEISPELVRVVAEASRFPSREAQPARRPPRIYRTGRTMQFNARATPQTVDAPVAVEDRNQAAPVAALSEHTVVAKAAG